jgi:hypothetical protein
VLQSCTVNKRQLSGGGWARDWHVQYNLALLLRAERAAALSALL